MSTVLFVAGCIAILVGVGLWFGLLVIRIKKITIEKKMIVLNIINGALAILGGIMNIILAFSW